MKKIWDISPPIDESSPVFPGDTSFQLHWTAKISPQCPVNVSAITLSPHLGSHADAPLHYDPSGAAIGQVDLQTFIGPCRVIHAIGVGPLINLKHLAHKLENLPERVLVRTYVKFPAQEFDSQLTAFAPQTLTALAELGVKLIGIDSASIDPADSKTLDSHQVIRQRNMRVLENLQLDFVEEGDYELIALPLKLMRADASPVRAILREL
ncbi:MAG: arylformamidase [Limnohabitans sp.]|nr:arylformamidase [Limnohabitans sp.]